MTDSWKNVHLPAAAAWVRTPIDARRYIDENLHKIAVPIQIGGKQKSFFLSEIPAPARMMFIVRMLDKYRKSGWLPYTVDDIDDAQKKAEAYAASVGGKPIIGVSTDAGNLKAGVREEGQWELTDEAKRTLGKDEGQ